MTNGIDLNDPSWFPVEFDEASDAFRLVRLTLEDIGRYAFLDRRMDLDWGNAVPLAADVVPMDPTVPAPAFVFHTAFCGSTVLARALHAPPAAVSLKEPRVLMLLSHASLGLAPEAHAALAGRVAPALRLLARPWSERGRVLIKPTNAVNRILPVLLGAAPASKAVLLHGELEPFLYSCCRKLPEAETRLRWMAQHLLEGTALAARLALPPGFQPNFVEACVLTWAASIGRFAEALAGDDADRLRTLSKDELLAAPARAVAACAEWLDLPGAMPGIAQRVDDVFGRDSKFEQRLFDPAMRAARDRQQRAAYGDVIRAALSWSEREVLPALAPAPCWKPLALR